MRVHDIVLLQHALLKTFLPQLNDSYLIFFEICRSIIMFSPLKPHLPVLPMMQDNRSATAARVMPAYNKV